MELTASGIENNNEKNIVNHLEIITRSIKGNPYYELRYKLKGDSEYYIGYSSYDLDIVLRYIRDYFTVVEDKEKEAHIDDAPEHKCCVCGKKFKMFPHNRYVSCSQISLLTFPTYYDTYDCPYCGCQNRLLERYSHLGVSQGELEDVKE